MSPTTTRWFLAALVVAAALARGDEGVARAADPPPCDTVDVEYALSANLELTDTPMGQGNGIYHIGPGAAVVRYERRDGVFSGPAKMIAYGMTERFTVNAKALFWNTHVTTDSHTTVSTDACGVVAPGSLTGRTLAWTGDLRGARTDGTLFCEGSLCGKFGAPPPGTSPLHVAPHDTRFQPWTFSADMQTFAMPKTWMSHSESPKQTAFIALSGREVRRTCVTARPCTR